MILFEVTWKNVVSRKMKKFSFFFFEFEKEKKRSFFGFFVLVLFFFLIQKNLKKKKYFPSLFIFSFLALVNFCSSSLSLVLGKTMEKKMFVFKKEKLTKKGEGNLTKSLLLRVWEIDRKNYYWKKKKKKLTGFGLDVWNRVFFIKYS